MNISRTFVAAVDAFRCAWIFSFALLAVQVSASTAADADYEAYQQASKAWHEIAVNLEQGGIEKKIDNLWRMEKAAFAEQAAALAFIQKHPTDPRRWIVVSKLAVWRPRFVKDWGALSDDGKAYNMVIDTKAAEVWKAQVADYRREMAGATDFPEELRQEWISRVKEADKAKMQEREFAAKWEARPFAPDFVVVDANGREIRLSDFLGKVVVLDFWATWCGPCMQAMPHNDEVARHYRDQDVIVLCVCTMDTRAKFDTWVQKNAAKYPNLIWAFDPTSSGKDGIASQLYLAPALPTQYVIDRGGHVAGTVVGYLKGELILEARLWDAGVKVDAAVREKGLAQIEERRTSDAAREKPIQELKRLLKQ